MKQYEIRYRMESGTVMVMIKHAADIQKALKAAISRGIRLDDIISIGEYEK